MTSQARDKTFFAQEAQLLMRHWSWTPQSFVGNPAIVYSKLEQADELTNVTVKLYSGQENLTVVSSKTVYNPVIHHHSGGVWTLPSLEFLIQFHSSSIFATFIQQCLTSKIRYLKTYKLLQSNNVKHSCWHSKCQLSENVC